MCNHVTNEVIFTNISRDQRAEILSGALNADGKLDFKVLPPPLLNIWRGNVSSQHQKTFPGNVLDWNRQNWGTKWNAYDIQAIEDSVDSLRLVYEPAWTRLMDGWSLFKPVQPLLHPQLDD